MEPALAQVEAWAVELERAVWSFERAVTQVEQGVDAGPGSQLLTYALRNSHEAQERVYTANAALDEVLVRAETTLQDSVLSENSVPTLGETSAPGAIAADERTPLSMGTPVCQGRYRLVRLLHARPRVHLYLARRVGDAALPVGGEQPLVAIRELVLSGLDQALRERVERAAFAEFAAPQLFGSPHLPGVGDHTYIENQRHYLVMQPRQERGNRVTFALPLSDLLPNPALRIPWPDMPTALCWGIQLCQTLARLHSMGHVLGEVTPDTLLVNRKGRATWSPILLPCWPPATPFWPGPDQGEAYRQVFSLGEDTSSAADERVFVAPETREGICNERSDIYALGAILYLLFTGNTPISALRMQAEDAYTKAPEESQVARRTRKAARRQSHEAEVSSNPALPHILNAHISPLLEQILLRSLALDPAQRFASAQDLAAALEGIHLKTDAPATLPQAKVSRLRRLLEWIRKY